MFSRIIAAFVTVLLVVAAVMHTAAALWAGGGQKHGLKQGAVSCFDFILFGSVMGIY